MKIRNIEMQKDNSNFEEINVFQLLRTEIVKLSQQGQKLPHQKNRSHNYS